MGGEDQFKECAGCGASFWPPGAEGTTPREGDFNDFRLASHSVRGDSVTHTDQTPMSESLDPTREIPELVRSLYGIVHKLEERFPGRRFTPDGHLVGSIGEVIAASRYGIILHGASAPGHDGLAADGRPVQIKATQGSQVGLRSEPQHLLVLRLEKDGNATEIYNGPGDRVWNAAGKMQPNGQRSVSLAKLRTLMASVPPDERLRPREVAG